MNRGLRKIKAAATSGDLTMMRHWIAASATLASLSATQAQMPARFFGAPQVWAPHPPELLPPSAPAAHRPSNTAVGAATLLGADGGALLVRLDKSALTQTAALGAFALPSFPVNGAGQALDLTLERFHITTPASRFVLGGASGDAALDFDPDSVVLLRGYVEHYSNSHVYLAVAETMVNGIIDLGQGYPSYGVSSRARDGYPLPAGQVLVFKALGSAGPTPDPFCQMLGRAAEPSALDAEPRKGLRQLQLAVETDNEYFQLFGNQTAAATYLLQLYGAVSDIYMRELNVRVDLVYSRIWPLPNEPFAPGLSTFQSYWQSNMTSVQRDAAQMFSGRADMPGGVAYLSSLCNGNAYSFIGNAVGFFVDVQSSSVFNYDPLCTAHELGHNCGTQHTQDYGLDICDQVTTPPRRGTIMSYCNQTVSGAMAVEDLTFHKVTRNAILQYLITIPSCVTFDCNQNGVPDNIDILMGISQDVNLNGIPDECEDCNHNGILDSIDIASGTSRDLNGNGIPDECEPDCNHNGVPDDRDIALGTSQDLYGDNVPDECDADLNHNGVSDYNEIMANMALDIDRNRVLDSVQDCDNNGIPDLTALEGAHDGWAASSVNGPIREYHSVTGVLMRISAAGATAPVRDLAITADRRILTAATNGVVEFDRLGAFVRVLVPIGTGGLQLPSALLITSGGTLLVADRTGNSVLEYNLTTGAFVRTFVAAGSGGLAAPMGLARGTAGDIFVTSETNNSVMRYDGMTGAFVSVFVTNGSGSLAAPKGLVFKPTDGNLLVASFTNTLILEYSGITGAFVRTWDTIGVHFTGPWGMRIGHDGQVYVSANVDPLDTHLTKAHILIFDIHSGFFVRSYVQALDSGLSSPTGFDFMPGNMTDCNRNQIPDSCDIASGFSTDFNHNGIPDECERTCYANCDLSTAPPILNANDFQCFLNAFAIGSNYANCDHSTAPPVLNANDFQCFLNAFAAGCP
jgi:DNA-binding beta-propeller fold protein YncE